MSLLNVEDLKTYYNSQIGVVKAVDGVSFSLNMGETLGVAGESGCGKTTVALSLMKLIPPSGKILNGRIVFENRDIVSMDETELEKVRWKEISIIFQGAMNALNPVRKIEDQIAEAILEHEDVDEKEALERSRDLLGLVGIDPSRGSEYPHEFSGGMKQRTMIAMALACNPKLVIADEPTMALDVMVQAQIMALIQKLREELGLSMILITHDLGILAENCHRIAIMYAGKILEYAGVLSIFKSPLHPYTKGLLEALPNIKGSNQALRSIPGAPPNLVNPPLGCRFHPRCPNAKSICRQDEPELMEAEKNHYIACHSEK